ncbi:MAG: HD-GYP domain-containing protein [Gemmatimonadota bacterium]|nr:MAG: HD-GYP domain-containing protein [Gemmatimonadota bacterium]
MKSRLGVYVASVAVAAVAVAAFILLRFPIQVSGFTAWAGVVALVLFSVIGEGLSVRGAGRAVFSVALIPTVAAVPLFGPAVAVVSTAISRALAQTVLQKQARIKSIFNTSQFVLAIGVASIVYVALGGPVDYWRATVDTDAVDFQTRTLLFATAGLVVTYCLINTGLVGLVISLDTGKRVLNIWRQLGPVALAADIPSGFLSLFAVFAFAEFGLVGLLAVLLPLYLLHQYYGRRQRLVRQNREVLEFTIRTIEAKDPYTSGHSVRVASLSRELAEALGLPEREAEDVETAGLLHDIGMIDFVFAEILGSPDWLTDVERELVRSHPDRGARLLASLSNFNKNVLAAVRHHHERYDGNGYPDRLAGEDIPLAARIIRVVEAADAMLSEQPYSAALPVEQVTTELRRLSGQEFDPLVVAKILESGLLGRAAGRAERDRTPLSLAKDRSGTQGSTS